MQSGKGLVISLAIFGCISFPVDIGAITSLDFLTFLPNQIGEYIATGDASREDLSKDDGMFHRSQRSYGSKRGTTCLVAIVKGSGVPKTIDETFAKGRKIKIENYDAVQILPEANVLAASVKLGPDFLVTAIVLNTKDQSIPVLILRRLKLKDLDSLGRKGVW
jgi:hypothetical protein